MKGIACAVLAAVLCGCVTGPPAPVVKVSLSKPEDSVTVVSVGDGVVVNVISVRGIGSATLIRAWGAWPRAASKCVCG
jgi:hypothetical protein